VQYEYDRKVDFARLSTYNWQKAHESGAIDRAVVDRFKDAVDEELQGKGLRVISDRPDFLIDMHVGTGDKVTFTDRGTYYDGPVSGVFSPGYSKNEYEEGTLALYFIDAESQDLIWHGIATGLFEIEMKSDMLDEAVRETVQKTLENFPPPAPK
jgi:hypothetical protein